MCGQFELKMNFLAFGRVLASRYGLEIQLDGCDTGLADLSPDKRVFPFKRGAVLSPGAGRTLALTPMQFSLTPSWSKEPRSKFATYNARIESITSKATWKVPLQRHHCVVPMTAFFEACHEGEFAGQMIRVTAARQEEILFAAAIFDRWKIPTEDIFLESFAIVTTAAGAQIQAAGHDRQPVFLQPQAIKDWITITPIDMNRAVEFLESSANAQEFAITHDRFLKKQCN